MAERLYLRDAYTATFKARIVERVLLPDGRLAVSLDRTAFFPGTGGLPADRGWLNHAQVVDVMQGEGDGEIFHVLSEEIWEDQVQARLDWARRLEAMRHHTAGHVLAHVFAQVSGATSAGLTVGDDQAFLDLDNSDVDSDCVEQVEAAANEVILSDRAIQVASVQEGQAHKIGLTVPAGATWPLQVMHVEGMDVAICSGVHVARTGEIGLIKVVSTHMQHKHLRVWFVSGSRALAEFRRVGRMLNWLASRLGVPEAQLASHVTRLASELDATQAELRTVRGKIIGLEAQALAAGAEVSGRTRIVQSAYTGDEHDISELRRLAQLIVTRPGLVALLGVAGDRAQLVFARSADVRYDMTVLVRVAAQVLNAQGGGQPALAETMPVSADKARVEAAIAKAAKLLRG